MNITGNWPQDEDWTFLHQMDQDHFPRPWNLAQWQELSKSVHQVYLWNQKDRKIGFVLLGHVKGDETAHLLKICIEPAFRGKGEALDFWKNVVLELKAQNIKKVFLEVEESNLIAQSFYKKVGFDLLRTIKGYYSDGENGIMMLLTL